MVLFLKPEVLLHHPRGSQIPLDTQASPLPDPQQVHVQPIQIHIATTPTPYDPLPFTRFFGPFHRQINQPQFLSINETIYDAGA